MSEKGNLKVVSLSAHRASVKKERSFRKWRNSLPEYTAPKVSFFIAASVAVVCGFVFYESGSYRAAAHLWLLACCFMVFGWSFEHHQNKKTDLYKTED